VTLVEITSSKKKITTKKIVLGASQSMDLEVEVKDVLRTTHVTYKTIQNLSLFNFIQI
jgi:hypothetical protein